MRMSWRKYVLILLVGIWPHLGCHQIPGDKSVQDLRPVPPNAGADKKQELTAADITQSFLAKADKLNSDGKTSDAIAMYEKMREPGNPEALNATKKLALIYERSNDLDRAELEYQRIVQQDPKDANAFNKLGEISYRRGHWYIAEKHLTKALALKPDHTEARINWAMTLAQQLHYEESIGEFAKVLPKAEAFCRVAFIMKLQGKLSDAIRAYEAALNLDPALAEARTELSKLRQANASESVTYRRAGVDMAPDVHLPEKTSTVMLTTPYGRNGSVEIEATPMSRPEGTGRQMLPRPTLPPLPDVDVPVSRQK